MRPRCCILHTWALLHFPHALQSDLFLSIYHAFMDVIFTRGFTLRRSTACVFRSHGWNAFACILWAQGSHWREQLYIGQTDVLPHTEHDVDLWFSWKHGGSASWNWFGWWANTKYVGFTAVLHASGDRSRVYHSFRENSVSSSSHFRESAGKPFAMFSHRRKSSQETRSDREGISSGRQPVQGKGETFFRFSDLEEASRLVLEEQREHLLAEAHSEILKQECKVDTLNTCIREFQRQAHSNRLGMDDVNYGYEESRREQARLHRTNTGVAGTSEPYERVVESISCGKLSYVPSQPTVVPSPCGTPSRDQCLRRGTWNLLGTSGNSFDSPLAPIGSSSINTFLRNASLLESKCYMRKPSARKYRGTCRWKWRKKSRDYFNAEICNVTIDHGFFLSYRRSFSTELHGWSIKTADLGASILQIPHTINVFMLEEKILNPSKCLFQFSLEGNVMDQRSGGGRFSGRFSGRCKVIALKSELYSFPNFCDAGCEDSVLL